MCDLFFLLFYKSKQKVPAFRNLSGFNSRHPQRDDDDDTQIKFLSFFFRLFVCDQFLYGGQQKGSRGQKGGGDGQDSRKTSNLKLNEQIKTRLFMVSMMNITTGTTSTSHSTTHCDNYILIQQQLFFFFYQLCF